jgi:hypothetical protein
MAPSPTLPQVTLAAAVRPSEPSPTSAGSMSYKLASGVPDRCRRIPPPERRAELPHLAADAAGGDGPEQRSRRLRAAAIPRALRRRATAAAGTNLQR